MDRTLTLTSPKASAALEHSTSRSILLELAAAENTIGELSRTLELSLSLLSYHVDRLCRLGLACVVGETRRTGRPAKRYRAVATRFFVPAHLASKSPGDALAQELRHALENHQLKQKNTGTLYSIDADGRRRIERVDRSTSGTAFEAWLLLPMDAATAEQFGNELRALIDRYAERKKNKAHAFLFHCAFARRN